MSEQEPRSRFEFDSTAEAGVELHHRAAEVVREFTAHSPPVKKRVSNTKRRVMLFTAIALAFQSVSQAWDGPTEQARSNDFTLADTRAARDEANADKHFERFANAVGAEEVVQALNGKSSAPASVKVAPVAPPSVAADGMTLIQQRRYAEAENWFCEARKTKPRNIELILGHARAMMHNNRIASAGALLDLAAEIDPANVEVACTRAKWHARTDLLGAIIQLRECPAASDAKVTQLRSELTSRAQSTAPQQTRAWRTRLAQLSAE